MLNKTAGDGIALSFAAHTRMKRYDCSKELTLYCSLLQESLQESLHVKVQNFQGTPNVLMHQTRLIQL